MAQLLLELLSEEIPARMQQKAAEDLLRLVSDGLKTAGLVFAKAQSFVTPRRLALAVDGLPEAQPDVAEERKGPKVDAPAQAIEGFLKSTGLTLDQCEKRDSGKGVFLFAVIKKKGRPTAEVLPEILGHAIDALPWPKSMRWGSHAVRWVRPLQKIVALFAGQVLPLGYGPVMAGNETLGHRFMAPGTITVSDFDSYRMALRNAKVILDHAARQEMIKAGAEKLAADAGLTLKNDPGLLAEVAGLVEWPIPLMGKIDDAFMDVPPEVLTTAMRSHQKYFSLLTGDGKLANRFVLVANREGSDGGGAIVAGNERVLRARLSDAKFFWDQDRKKSLESRVPKLAERVFHAKLGSDLERIARIRKLAVEIAKFVPGADGALVDRAAQLCKADLMSGMVGEFPELQGIMGRYYARHDGEKPEVAEAIAEHYSPLGPSDRCPTAPASVAVALADKIDMLVGFWLIDEKPTGSKDPFALRRAALGIIRLIVENKIRVGLGRLFALATHGYRQQNHPAIEAGIDKRALEQRIVGVVPSSFYEMPDLTVFFADRLKVHLREQGVRHDHVAAVFAVGGEDDLVRLLARVEALKGFLASEDGSNLLTAHRRAANIVRIEEKKDAVRHDGEVAADALVEAEEKALHAALEAARDRIVPAMRAEDFTGAMAALASLRGPVDAFFAKVTVNSEDKNLRANRLRLLSRIGAALGGVADFTCIEGG